MRVSLDEPGKRLVCKVFPLDVESLRKPRLVGTF